VKAFLKRNAGGEEGGRKIKSAKGNVNIKRRNAGIRKGTTVDGGVAVKIKSIKKAKNIVAEVEVDLSPPKETGRGKILILHHGVFIYLFIYLSL
jgi:hypothetical protein